MNKLFFHPLHPNRTGTESCSVSSHMQDEWKLQSSVLYDKDMNERCKGESARKD